ncbi:MAG: pirin family protein [Actinomycetota bacterium]
MGILRQVVGLGPQWPTIDPFLFCAHHLDHYPAGTGSLGPEPALLSGRDIGQDFAGHDGWNMYHGDVVPGFPQHPHRGFETVSFVRQGLIDHADSLGATARFGRGDVQWMTAGRGIVHAEMFPLLDREHPNPLELFQIWLNLPADDKLVEPHFSMLWSADIPTVGSADSTQVTLIAGALDDTQPPNPPPNSWAGRPESAVAIWHGEMRPGSEWVLPPAANDEIVRTLYLFAGGPLQVDDESIPAASGAVLSSATASPTLRAGHEGASWMLLQGRPIAEPVAQYGPFVMNTEDEIRQAFADYQRTQFGGWPWPSDAPHHGPDRSRFAVHADGREEVGR